MGLSFVMEKNWADLLIQNSSRQCNSQCIALICLAQFWNVMVLQGGNPFFVTSCNSIKKIIPCCIDDSSKSFFFVAVVGFFALILVSSRGTYLSSSSNFSNLRQVPNQLSGPMTTEQTTFSSLATSCAVLR